jgi:hypothetical protein
MPNSIYRLEPMVSPGSNDDDDDDGRASAAAAVCCMCGDQGLPGELFQCALCLRRLQHRYGFGTCTTDNRDRVHVHAWMPLPAIASVLPFFNVNRPSPGRPAGRFLNLACVVSLVCVLTLRSCRYCSAEYPRTAAYSVCNWCLTTTDKQVGGGSPAAAKSLTTMAKRRASSRQLNGSRGGHHGDVDPYSGGGGSGGCSRSAFPAEPQKPVKKPKKSHEGAAAAKGKEEVPTGARTKPPFTAKARVPRYKLLAEVIR